MKNGWIFLVLMIGMALSVCAGDAKAQSTHPQDVLDSTLRFGDPWGPARSQRCQAALRHGWGNASSCGAMVVPRHARGYNQRRGGFFGRGGYDGYYGGGRYGSDYGYGGYYGRGGRWAPVVGEGIRTVGDIVINSQNNNTIRQVEGQRIRLDDKAINNRHEIDLRREDRADARLQMEQDQFEDGRYVGRPIGPASQSAPVQSQSQDKGKNLYNHSSCTVKAFLGNQLAFIIPPNGMVPSNMEYELQAEGEGCSITVIYHEGDALIVPGR